MIRLFTAVHLCYHAISVSKLGGLGTSKNKMHPQNKMLGSDPFYFPLFFVFVILKGAPAPSSILLKLYYIILYYIISNQIILYHIIKYYIIKYYIIKYYIILYIILYHILNIKYFILYIIFKNIYYIFKKYILYIKNIYYILKKNIIYLKIYIIY